MGGECTLQVPKMEYLEQNAEEEVNYSYIVEKGKCSGCKQKGCGESQDRYARLCEVKITSQRPFG